MIKFYLYKLRKSIGILGISILILITSGWWQESLNEEVGVLNQRLYTLKNLAAQRQAIARVIEANRDDFARFEACEFNRALNPDILQKSCPYPIDFGPSSGERGDAKEDSIIFQEVSFTIQCLKDTDVYLFVNQLLNRGPGIFQIHDVTITRVSSLSEDILETIEAGKPQFLFESKILATWIHR